MAHSRLLLLLGMLPAVLACQAASEAGLPAIVAHRGASHAAPENTLAAFRLAWKLEADAIEGDFYLTRDGFVVCHHDRTTKKTAGLDVPVEDQTREGLQRLDVGAWKGAQWAGERIPTLEAVLETVPEGRTVLIELKSDARAVPFVAEAVASSRLRAEQVRVICFDADVVAAARQRMPEVKAFWLVGFEEEEEGSGNWGPTAAEIVRTARRIGADGVDLQARLEVLDEPFVAALRAAGLEFHAWTVNDLDLARRLHALGVDSITTDRPGWLRESLAR